MSKAARAPAPSPDSPPKDFESALAELETLVGRMESGDLSLDDSLRAYQRGMQLAAWCRKTLTDAEARVKILEDGVFKDFQPEAENGRGD